MIERDALGRRLLITALVLILLPVALMAARGRRISVDVGGDWQAYFIDPPDLTSDRTSTAVNLPMQVKIGADTYDRLWINENGFVFLTNGAATPAPSSHAPGAQSLSNIDGNVIAAFYSDVQSRRAETQAECNLHIGDSCGLDISTETLSLLEDQVPQQFDIDYRRGARVTWGMFGNSVYPEGVAVREGSVVVESKRGSIQIKLIDRSAAPNQAGDFDLELGYNGIPWENGGIVGVKAGGVLLDFSAFYTSFAGANPYANPGPNETDHPCYEASGADPSFDPEVPFACNNITISFRNGVPNLRTYSADVSAASGSTVSANAGAPFTFNLTLANDDYDAASNLTSSLNMPAGWSFVSTTPGSSCSANGTQLSCTHGALSRDTSTNVGLTFRSSAAGALSASLALSADQFDPVPSNNSVTLSASIAPTADLTLTGCTAPASTVRGTTVTVTCSVRNDGPQEATGVSLSTQLSSAVTFGSGTGCSASGTAVTCSRSSIAVGATADFPMTLNTASASSASMAVSVTAAQNDPAPNNNAYSIAVAIFEAAPSPPSTGGGGGGGGGSFSLLTLLSLGWLLRGRRMHCA